MTVRKAFGRVSAVVAATVVVCESSQALAQGDRSRPGREAVLTDIAARVQAQTGPMPSDCGQFFASSGQGPWPTAEQIESAIQCGRVAARQRSSFWFLLGGHGLDSWVAQGLMGDDDGTIRRFSYDSDPSGGSGIGARFTTARCLSPSVHQYVSGGLELECLNDPWKLAVNVVTIAVSSVASLVGLLLAHRGWARTAAATLSSAASIVAVVGAGLVYVGAGRWATTAPALLVAMALLATAVRIWRKPVPRSA